MRVTIRTQRPQKGLCIFLCMALLGIQGSATHATMHLQPASLPPTSLASLPRIRLSQEALAAAALSGSPTARHMREKTGFRIVSLSLIAISITGILAAQVSHPVQAAKVKAADNANPALREMQEALNNQVQIIMEEQDDLRNAALDSLISLLLLQNTNNGQDPVLSMAQTRALFTPVQIARILRVYNQEKNSYFRKNVVQLLGLLERSELIPFFIKSLDDVDITVQAHAADALRAFSDPLAEAALAQRQSRRLEYDKIVAATWFAYYGTPYGASTFLDVTIKKYLLKLGDASIAYLTDVVNDRATGISIGWPESMRMDAVQCLTLFLKPAANAALETATDDPIDRVALGALYALSTREPAFAHQAIVRALQRSTPMAMMVIKYVFQNPALLGFNDAEVDGIFRETFERAFADGNIDFVLEEYNAYRQFPWASELAKRAVDKGIQQENLNQSLSAFYFATGHASELAGSRDPHEFMRQIFRTLFHLSRHKDPDYIPEIFVGLPKAWSMDARVVALESDLRVANIVFQHLGAATSLSDCLLKENILDLLPDLVELSQRIPPEPQTESTNELSDPKSRIPAVEHMRAVLLRQERDLKNYQSVLYQSAFIPGSASAERALIENALKEALAAGDFDAVFWFARFSQLPWTVSYVEAAAERALQSNDKRALIFIYRKTFEQRGLTHWVGSAIAKQLTGGQWSAKDVAQFLNYPEVESTLKQRLNEDLPVSPGRVVSDLQEVDNPAMREYLKVASLLNRILASHMGNPLVVLEEFLKPAQSNDLPKGEPYQSVLRDLARQLIGPIEYWQKNKQEPKPANIFDEVHDASAQAIYSILLFGNFQPDSQLVEPLLSLWVKKMAHQPVTLTSLRDLHGAPVFERFIELIKEVLKKTSDPTLRLHLTEISAQLKQIHDQADVHKAAQRPLAVAA